MSEDKIAAALERIAAAAEQIATLMSRQGIKELTDAKPVRRHYGEPQPEPANGQKA